MSGFRPRSASLRSASTPRMRLALPTWLVLSAIATGAAACSETAPSASERSTESPRDLLALDSPVVLRGPDPPARPVLVSETRAHRFIVADYSDKAIKIYDAAGMWVGTFGRAGEGPGEFVSLMSAQPIGDSILAYDFLLRRLTVFDPATGRARTERVSEPAFQLRVLDDSLLLWIRHPGQRGPLLRVADRHGRTRATFFDNDGFFRDEQLRFHTTVLADGKDGVIFAGLLGDDSLHAFDYSGRQLASGPIDPVEPLPSLDRLLAQARGQLQKPNGEWFHHGARVLLKVVALPAGRAALFVAPYDARSGTDILDGGELLIVRRDGKALRTLVRTNVPAGLMGRDAEGRPLFLAYGDPRGETTVLIRTSDR